jgi:hypothetical protein
LEIADEDRRTGQTHRLRRGNHPLLRARKPAAEPARSDGNYRVYTQAHAERLTFIRNCRTLDMTLEEIRSLLACATARRISAKT